MSKRKCCIGLLVALALVMPTPARAGIIHDLIIGPDGNVLTATQLGLDFPRHAVSSNGVLNVTGLSDGIGARQLLGLNTGILGPVEVFHAQVGPGGGSQIEGAARLNGGSIVYLGLSDNGLRASSPTYWLNDPTAPVGVTLTPGSSGSLEGASKEGTIVGWNAGGAAVGQLGGVLEPLIGGGSNLALDITADGKFIVGTNGIWELTGLGYQRIDTTGFGIPDNGFIPQGFDGAAIDPVVGQAVFAGIYVDLNLFVENTGFWAEDGTLLGTFPGSFQDFQIWEGELVAGLNGQDDGFLLAMTDMSSRSIASVIGQPGFLVENGLFEGSAGFLIDGPNGSFATSHQTVSAVPEPSSLLLWLFAAISWWLKHRFGWLMRFWPSQD